MIEITQNTRIVPALPADPIEGMLYLVMTPSELAGQTIRVPDGIDFGIKVEVPINGTQCDGYRLIQCGEVPE